MILVLLTIVVVLAFSFSLINGFMDGGGLVSTVITTRALNPLTALLIVGFFEIVGLFVLGHQVADTLRQHLIVLPASATAIQVLGVLIAAQAGALLWNTQMWRRELPSSSSHALVGGLAGAFLAAYGCFGIQWSVFFRIFLGLGLVPLAGAFLSFALARASYWVGSFLTPSAGRHVGYLQVGALACLALVHGSNDGQKSLGLILLALGVIGVQPGFRMVPIWLVMLGCGGSLALGVIFGSQGVIRTLGKRLYRVQTLQSFCAQFSTMILVGVSSLAGYPVSTTHVVSTSVLGVGAAVHPRGIRWDIVADIALVWLVTIPAAGCLSAALVWLGKGMWHVVS